MTIHYFNHNKYSNCKIKNFEQEREFQESRVTIRRIRAWWNLSRKELLLKSSPNSLLPSLSLYSQSAWLASKKVVRSSLPRLRISLRTYKHNPINENRHRQ